MRGATTATAAARSPGTPGHRLGGSLFPPACGPLLDDDALPAGDSFVGHLRDGGCRHEVATTDLYCGESARPQVPVQRRLVHAHDRGGLADQEEPGRKAIALVDHVRRRDFPCSIGVFSHEARLLVIKTTMPRPQNDLFATSLDLAPLVRTRTENVAYFA